MDALPLHFTLAFLVGCACGFIGWKLRWPGPVSAVIAFLSVVAITQLL